VKTLKGIEECLRKDLESRAKFEACEPPLLGPRGTELDLKKEIIHKIMEHTMKAEKRDELSDLHSWVLEFLGDNHSSTDHEELSFECGILATVDWLVGADSVYVQIIKEALQEWEEDDEEVTD